MRMISRVPTYHIPLSPIAIPRILENRNYRLLKLYCFREKLLLLLRSRSICIIDTYKSLLFTAQNWFGRHVYENSGIGFLSNQASCILISLMRPTASRFLRSLYTLSTTPNNTH